MFSRSILALTLVLAAFGQSGEKERGLQAFRRKDFRTAEREFRTLVQNQPNNALGWKLLGMVYTAQEDYKRAEEPFARACSLNPREENACYYLGRVYYSLSRFEDARTAFRAALEHSSDRDRAAAGLALALSAMGRLSEAEKYFKEAVRLGQKQAAIDYGLFLARNGRGREALDVLSKAGAQKEMERVRKEMAAAPSARSAITPITVRLEPQALPMVVRNSAAGEKHLIETMLTGAAVLDYDGDGWPDIFISNGAAIPTLRKTDASFYNRLFRNNRDGTFTDVTERAGLAGSGYCMGVAAADYDNDGHVDLFVTGVRGNALYHNRGDGTFENVTGRAGVGGNGKWSVAAGWFDSDNDGLLDLFVVRYVAWDPAHETYCGMAKPGYRTYCHPRYYEALPNALYHNEGDGTFVTFPWNRGLAADPGGVCGSLWRTMTATV